MGISGIKLIARAEYMALKEAEQEIENKTKRALAIEELREKNRNLHIKRARTSLGLEEIFTSPKEMLEFAQNTVKQCESLICYCDKLGLQPDQVLIGIVGSKEEYEINTDEEGNLLDLSDYIGSRIDSFLNSRWEEEKKQLMIEKFYKAYLNLKCSSCGRGIEGFIFVDDKLMCSRATCKDVFEMLCPLCRSRLRLEGSGDRQAFRCSSCKLVIPLPHLCLRFV